MGAYPILRRVMRRITRATWLVMGAALLASLLSAAALSRVASQPRLATPLPGATATPLLSVVTPEGVVVITANGGYRVRPDLGVELIEWKQHPRILSIHSVAWAGKLAVLATVETEGAPEPSVLVVEGNQLTLRAYGAYNALAMTAEGGELILYADDDGTVTRTRIGGEPSRGPKVPRDAEEGVLLVDGKPYILIGERGAHWLLDWDRKLHPMPEGAYSVWSASLLRPPLNSPSRVPFFDAHGRTHVFAPAGAPVLRVEADGTLAPVAISRSLDEPGVIVTSVGDQRVEV